MIIPGEFKPNDRTIFKIIRINETETEKINSQSEFQ